VTEMSRADCAKALHVYLQRFSMTATERYEADAEAFYAATGLMAPGKDAPMAGNFGSEQERRDGYQSWVDDRNSRLQDVIAAAVLFLREPRKSADAVARSGG
jgi:hypothetical protein